MMSVLGAAALASVLASSTFWPSFPVGGSVQWNGNSSNLSQLETNNAEPFLEGIGWVFLTGLIWDPSNVTDCSYSSQDIEWASATTTLPTALVANTVYYVYYEDNSVLGFQAQLVTTVPPTETGYPPYLYYENGKVTCPGTLEYDYYHSYLGSFITDGSANIMVFRRAGDEVILDGLADTISHSANGVASGSATLSSGAESTATITIGSAGSGNNIIPATASAILVDIYATNPNSSSLPLYTMDPTLNTLGASCAGQTTDTMVLPASGLGFFPQQRIPYLPSSGGTITVGQCGSSTSFSVNAVLRGYVEAPTSLDF
jgi:hypothetical protein